MEILSNDTGSLVRPERKETDYALAVGNWLMAFTVWALCASLGIEVGNTISQALSNSL